MTFFGPSMTEKTMVEARARKISGSSQLWWAVGGQAMHVSLVHVRACVRGVELLLNPSEALGSN